MGLFEKIFKPKQENIKSDTWFKTLTAYQPVFTDYNGSLYEMDIIRASIDAIARQCSKLNIDIQGTANLFLKNKLKHAPNEFQTWSQFLYRTATILYVQNNCFIVPVFDEYGRTTGVYPVVPDKCEVVEVNGKPYLKYTFKGGKRASVELSKCGILNRFQFKQDFFGDSNKSLNTTCQLINIYNQGISEGVKSSATYRFMASLTNFSKEEDLEKERNRFNKHNFKNRDGGGVLLFPNTYKDIKQITSSPYVPSADQRKQINENVFNYFGVNEKVLQNSANDEELDAFFNGCIEPFAIQMSDVLTKMFYSLIEQTNGNKIYVASNRLQYMSVSHKIQMAQQLGDRGLITINEVRALFNLPPLEDGDKAPIRGEYYMVGDKNENN